MKSKIIIGAALAALLLACIDSRAQTNVYRWTDKDGKVHFSDTPPPADASSTSQKRMGGGYVSPTTSLTRRRSRHGAIQ